MKLSDFIVLDEKEKTSVVLHMGILVAKRRLQHCIIFLFQLENYYVETYCNYESNAVQEFRVFDGTQLLQPYLETISIHELMKGV